MIGFLAGKKASSLEHSPAELKKFLESNPFKYKQCILHINSEQNMYAKVLTTR